MPEELKLHEFGALLFAAFGSTAYHVGSSLVGKAWRDVDVRLILSDDEYAAAGFGDPTRPWHSERWVATVRAFAACGREMTGLPVDFQIQQQSWANEKFPSPGHLRSTLGIVGVYSSRLVR